MKHFLLGLIALITLTTACVSKKDFEELQDKVYTLENTVVANNMATLALIAEHKQQTAAVIQQTANGIAVTIQAAVDAQNQVNADLAAANAAREASIAELAVLIENNSDLAAILQTQIDDLDAQIEDLEDDLDDLDEIVDELEDNAVTVDFTSWAPVFATQVSGFDQSRSLVLDGVELTTTESRAINVTSATVTSTVRSTELAEGVDVNQDLDHADTLHATHTATVYTGTVSGTNSIVGTHTTTGTTSAWVVIANN